MRIKLTGELHPELLSLGLKAGDIINNAGPGQKGPDIKTDTGQLYFDVHGYVVPQTCVVWPDNYEILTPNKNGN
jgi:hypothetical protein